jgi:hypothetical protein
MPRTLLPGEEPPSRSPSPSPDDSKVLVDSADKEESDDDKFEMMATVKAEPGFFL